ncbi:uroporphyrinogen decarboxylase/cobalamine-independent methonine synthase family protein [Candidatus Desulforudis audaxviator]|uniref:Methionine synthase, vitamin-B12 independent n=1 Tax=Desulforudis audaxviator (strain MP104C) TaxID=477974 RepID=B1I4P6_DESAP|nr:hypothetical protein [Candidatus Desulforudis audaxviator]ACA59956.1 conserved hypothetical protein [Candidatus Desulforudis audaxviator MP104C]AZK59971.1 hypothetical protein Daudx_1424 [Candidatus Desulforudis audaxviator]
MWAPGGLATGIGSLPYTEPEPALNLIGAYLPAMPHWPQLPLLGPQEGFVLQFLYPLLETGLLERDGDKVYFATGATDWPERLAAFYALYLAAEEGDREALERFAIPREAASGFYAFLERAPAGPAAFVKGQVVGPLTAAFQLTDAGGRPAYYDEQLRDLVVKNLAFQGRWQAEALGGSGGKVLVFVDEPGVSIYGQSTYITVTREMIVEDLEAVVAGIRAVGAKAAIHSCAAVDWSILMDTGAEVLSLDAYGYFDSLLPYRAELDAFLARGGVVAWGIVPTSDRVETETVESLTAMLEAHWKELSDRGIPADRLRRQCLITPSCGAGTLTVALAERIYRLTAGVSEVVRSGGAGTAPVEGF